MKLNHTGFLPRLTFLFVALIFACAPRVWGGDGSVSLHASGATIGLSGGVLELTLVRANVLRVHYLPKGESTAAALVISPQAPTVDLHAVTVSRVGERVVLASRQLRAVFDTHSDVLQLFEPRRRKAGDADQRGRLLESNLARFARGPVTVGFSPAGAALYGVGGVDAFTRDPGGLLRTGRQLATAGEQGDAGAPFVWSTSGFGVLVDSQKTEFDLSPGHIEVLKQTRPDADVYLILGSPKAIFAAVADLTGHAPLFPKWSLGFINSQWGLDEGELLRIVRRYRAMHIPLDAFSMDFDWKAWGEDDYGEFRWNRRKFPDGPSGTLDRELTALGVHLIGIMKPRIHVDTVEGRYASAHHLWIAGEKASLDYFSHKPVRDLDFDIPATRKWFFTPTLKHSFETGVVGWWNDEADETGDDKQFFNMERALYAGQRAFTDARVFSLNRNFWLGAQRYAYGLWSGDIESGFSSMAAQRERMLAAIDVGEMWWGMDGGGFHHHPSSENYARWIEFDAFAPICRVHGTRYQLRQPWVYGATASAAATAALDLRYHLMPYIYSYAWADHERGIGLVRPLTFGWPGDPKVRNDYSAWLFGQWLLVSPVVQRHQSEKRLYLPSGTWTDYFTGVVYHGGQTLTLPTDSTTWSDIPLFIRQGAILPTEPPMDYVGEHPVTTVTVDVFPASQPTHFDYYDDDGETYAYEHGVYYLQRLGAQAFLETPLPTAGQTQIQTQIGAAAPMRIRSVIITVGKPHGTYRPALQHYVFAVHGVSARTVHGSGAKLQHVADSSALDQCHQACWTTTRDRFGAVTDVRLPASKTMEVRITG